MVFFLVVAVKTSVLVVHLLLVVVVGTFRLKRVHNPGEHNQKRNNHHTFDAAAKLEMLAQNLIVSCQECVCIQ